ncbi:hypothetical protein RCC89_18615 [Cytophagaceae bacterium ABcell3]|nr:hypothetical protein RCC89_18615 [Cytophagaceae bacterium ABcell3]
MNRFNENELIFKNKNEITLRILINSAIKNEYAGLINLKEMPEIHEIINLYSEN